MNIALQCNDRYGTSIWNFYLFLFLSLSILLVFFFTFFSLLLSSKWSFFLRFLNLSIFLLQSFSFSVYFALFSFFFSALTKLNVQDEITEKKQEKTSIDTNNVSMSDTKTGVKGTASGMPNKSPEIHKSRALLAATYSKVTASEFEVR